MAELYADHTVHAHHLKKWIAKLETTRFLTFSVEKSNISVKCLFRNFALSLDP